MAKSIFLLVAFVAAFNILKVFGEVSFIKKCKARDSECIRQNAMANRELFGKGIPEYNVEPLDPAFFKTIDASINNLKLVASNVEVKGLSKCNIKKIERNVQKSSIFLDIICDVIIDGDYDMDGHLLLFAMKGNGKIHAELHQVEIKVDAILEPYNAQDGKKHWRVSSWTHSFELHAKNKLHFDNLLNDNKALATIVSGFLDNNANSVIEEVGKPVVNAVIEKVVNNISALLKKAPVEDLSQDI